MEHQLFHTERREKTEKQHRAGLYAVRQRAGQPCAVCLHRKQTGLDYPTEFI